MIATRSPLFAFAALLLTAWGLACTPPPVLPPTASYPDPRFPGGVGNLGRVPATPGLPTSLSTGGNPWRPTVSARPWRYIVLHHTATTSGSVETINESHLKNTDPKTGTPWLGIGYHFVIGNGQGMADGAIEPTFRWRTQIQGAHAGSPNKDYNEVGIGVCLVGNFENAPPTAAQRRSVKLLVQTLKSEYRISSADVVGHKDIRGKPTECPGKYFPMSEVAADEPPILFGLNAEGVPFEQVATVSGSPLR